MGAPSLLEVGRGPLACSLEEMTESGRPQARKAFGGRGVAGASCRLGSLCGSGDAALLLLLSELSML